MLLSKLIENILTWSYENFKVNRSCTCTDKRQKCQKRYNISGHKCVWAQTCVGTIVCGHNRVWAQSCLGTNVCGHNRVCSIVWAQSCMGPIVVEPSRCDLVSCLVSLSLATSSKKYCLVWTRDLTSVDKVFRWATKIDPSRSTDEVIGGCR